MRILHKMSLVPLALGLAGAGLVGCSGAENHTPPPPQNAVNDIQNNPNMPRQAKAAAMSIMRTRNATASQMKPAEGPPPGAAPAGARTTQ